MRVGAPLLYRCGAQVRVSGLRCCLPHDTTSPQSQFDARVERLQETERERDRRHAQTLRDAEVAQFEARQSLLRDMDSLRTREQVVGMVLGIAPSVYLSCMWPAVKGMRARGHNCGFEAELHRSSRSPVAQRFLVRDLISQGPIDSGLARSLGLR